MDCLGIIKLFFLVLLCEVKCFKVFIEIVIVIIILIERILILVFRCIDVYLNVDSYYCILCKDEILFLVN